MPPGFNDNPGLIGGFLGDTRAYQHIRQPIRGELDAALMGIWQPLTSYLLSTHTGCRMPPHSCQEDSTSYAFCLMQVLRHNSKPVS